MILPHFTTLKVELLHPVWWLVTIWHGVGRSWLMHMVAADDAGGVCASVTSYERLEYDHIRHTTPCALRIQEEHRHLVALTPAVGASGVYLDHHAWPQHHVDFWACLCCT
jgi:hypothetical protein